MAADLDLVMHKIARVFPEHDASEVRARLDEYGLESHEQERRRVQLAILKLCQENGPGELEKLVRLAKYDYRDILAWAEYPHQMHLIKNEQGASNVELIRRDSEQYQAWLNGDSDT